MRPLAFVALLLLAGCSADTPVGPPAPGALRFNGISAGYFHTCALAATGTAWCWGENVFGTLGDGTRSRRLRPARVISDRPFTALDAGAGHNCALDAEGGAWCWGQNDEGQLGDGSFTIRDRPAAVATALRFASISAGHAHSCALTPAGQAWCWGDNINGQLGNGMSADKSPVPVPVSSAVAFGAIHAGYYQTCALDLAGSAWCWGRNDSGQIGDGTTEPRTTPTLVSGNRTFTELAPGDRFVCGTVSGSAWCWGAARHGELGPHSGSPEPVQIPGSTGSTMITTSMGTSTFPVQPYACVLRSTAILCWGGAIRALRPTDPALQRVEGPASPRSLAAGSDHLCALDRRGYAWCGGGNYFGQVGDGSTTDRSALVPVAGPGATAAAGVTIGATAHR